MKRKVNLVGQSTLTVSLPNKWIKENNIKKGDELEISEGQNKLTIAIKPQHETKQISIKLQLGNDWYIHQIIRNLYTSGYDEVVLEFDNPKIILNIQDVIQKLVGFEIIEQHKNRCTIRAISTVNEGSFEMMVRRSFIQTTGLFEKLIEDFSKNDARDIATAKQMRYNIYKSLVFCRRLIVKNHPYSEMKNDKLQAILSRIGDIPANLLYLYEYAHAQRVLRLKKETIEYLKQTSEHYALFYDAMYKQDILLIEKLNKNRELLITKKMTAFLEKNAGIDAVIIHYCAEMVRVIASLGGALLIYAIEK